MHRQGNLDYIYFIGLSRGLERTQMEESQEKKPRRLIIGKYFCSVGRWGRKRKRGRTIIILLIIFVVLLFICDNNDKGRSKKYLFLVFCCFKIIINNVYRTRTFEMRQGVNFNNILWAVFAMIIKKAFPQMHQETEDIAIAL